MGGQGLEKLLVGKKFLVKCHLNKIGFHLKKDSAPRGFIDGALPFGASGGHLSAPSTSEKIIKENELNAALFPNRSLCTGHKNIYVGGVLRGRNLCPVPPKTKWSGLVPGDGGQVASREEGCVHEEEEKQRTA